jgi:hypothetical protein
MKVATVFKGILKTFIWMVSVSVLLFILIVLIIQIPAVQNKIVHFATTFVSTKFHTKVEISHISISFPKLVVAEGLYLEDLNQDTLIYAGKAKINIALYDLLKNKITINSVYLEDATIRLHNTKTDPLFNYNFLLTAFSDTTDSATSDSLTTSKWTFSLVDISLNNIRFGYNDEYAGRNVATYFKNSEVRVKEFRFKESVYQLDELFMDGLTANILISETGNISESESGTPLPIISSKHVHISHSTVSFADSTASRTVFLAIDQGELKDVSIDLPSQFLSSNEFNLSKSKIYYHTFEPELPSNSIQTTSESNWKVSVNRAEMMDNTLIYKSGNQPELKNGFDPDYWEYSQLALEATGFYYSTESMKASVKSFSATDQNNFAITHLEGDLSMDEHSITTNKLKAKTVNSSIDADFNIQYNSLAALTDSMEFNSLKLDLRNLRLKNSDALYFNPTLIELPFFQNKENMTTASGKVAGSLNDLKGENLAVQTGSNTVLTTDFILSGLPNFETAFYDFPNLKLVSGRKDLMMMAGEYLPDSIVLPDNISLQLVFRGKLKEFESTAKLTSSFGAANLVASVDPDESFSGKISLSKLNVGRFLKDTVRYGPVTLTAEANGKGLDMKTIQAKIKANATELYMNNYAYHNLKLDGAVSGKQFEGKINGNDENLVFDFDGLVNLNPAQERYKFKLNVKGADLQKLRLTEKDSRISFVATADLKGGSASQMNGTAGITNIIIARDGKKYVLDSFLSATVNETGKSELNVSSALIGIKYSGTISPDALPKAISQFINNYFPVSGTGQEVKKSEQSKFSFEIQLHNHPIISEVLFPQLTEFEPGLITGSFDGTKNEMKISATMNKMVYGSTQINDFKLDVKSDQSELNYYVSCAAISNSQIKLDHLLLEGKLAENQLFTNISSTDGKNKKLLIRSKISKENEYYKLTLDPKEFYLVNNSWDIAADNFIEFGKKGFRIHHLFMNHAGSQINIASVNDKFNDDLNITIRNFKLDDLSRIVEKDTNLLKGNLDGNLLLKRVNNSYGLVADATVGNLVVHEIPIGNLILKARNPEGKKFDIDVNLTGPDNNLTATGYLIPNGGDQAISIKTTIQSLSMKTVEAFSMGQISEAAGTLTGNILAEGNAGTPDISGELVFNDAFLKPAFLNNRLELKHETIEMKKDGIYFKNFTMLDGDQHTAIIDGAVQMNRFSDFIFDLQVNTKDFLLFNTTGKNNKEFFGRMVIDSKISVNGPMNLPVVNAKVKMKKGSNFTISVPEDKLTTDKGEDVVEFENEVKLNPILLRGDKKGGQTLGMTGYDLSSIIEVDKEATLRLLMDPASTDSLVVKGEAALSFTMDQSGKMSLTGAYNLNEGSYMVSLETVVKKKFDIDAGSTIIWNGDPLDAEISINAIYSVRASPYDLVADQLSGLSEMDKGGYKQRYPFQVILKLRGKILHPEISFEIQLRPEDKGILGGAVTQKLSMLNEDPSALNKQVFALLVLNRFIQENPFQSETAGTSALIRSTVSKFLSSQINQLSSKVLPGMELNFDIQSYNDYQTGQAKGRTQVEIGVKKQLFNERLSVQLGGAVDVEGDRARQNSASEITSDVTVEYKLNKDGSFRLKGFRHNQYEGAIEGQLVETGAGVVYVRDFNRWSRLFKPYKRRLPKSPNGGFQEALPENKDD